MHRLAKRLTHLWRSLTRLVRGPEPPEPACYDPKADPVVRRLRLEQLQSERRTRHNSPIRRASWPESAIYPERRKKGLDDA